MESGNEKHESRGHARSLFTSGLTDRAPAVSSLSLSATRRIDEARAGLGRHGGPHGKGPYLSYLLRVTAGWDGGRATAVS